MVRFLNNGPLWEHQGFPNGVKIISDDWPQNPEDICFQGKPDAVCLEFKVNQTVHTSYFIGVDWIEEEKLAVYVEPKVNQQVRETHYLAMLFHTFRHPDVARHCSDLFEIKLGKPFVEIDQRQDLITPLLVIQFLSLLKKIVQKGLRKSYYQVEENLQGKVKGKVLVGKTIKHNHLKNRLLKTYCAYEEFGINGLENRLLKKAFLFSVRYLSNSQFAGYQKVKQDIAYITPVLQPVSHEVEEREVNAHYSNPFFREYAEAIRLAKTLLKRFGYSISNIHETQRVKVPPFWIDMSKLFELYVLGLLKDAYGKGVLYGKREAGGKYGLPDFLIPDPSCPRILDAKYKEVYKVERYEIDNIRQLSGYARDLKVLEKLGLKGQEDRVVDCIVIFPNTDLTWSKDFQLKLEMGTEISGFSKFQKIGVPLPML